MNLKRIEPFLGWGWQHWRQLVQLIRKVFTLQFDLQGHLLLREMLKQNKLHWKNNDPEHLLKSVESYFRLKSLLSDNPPSDTTGRSLHVEGWANPAIKKYLKKEFRDIRIKNIFRPDIWYLHGKEFGLYSGFRLSNWRKEDDISEAFNAIVHGLDVHGPRSSLGGRLFNVESVVGSDSDQSLTWFSIFSRSPRALVNILECTADRSVARVILDNLPVLGISPSNSDFMKCVLKLVLIADYSPDNFKIDDWDIYEIENPKWEAVDVNIVNRDSRRCSHDTFAILNDVHVSNGGTIIQNGKFLNWDYAQHPSLDFVAGNNDAVVGTHVTLNKCFVHRPNTLVTLKSGILLSSRADSNWFHFLIETLPRLYLVEDQIDQSVPVLISNRVPKTGIEVLQLVTSRKILKLDPSVLTVIENGVLPGPVLYHPDTQFFRGNEKPEYVNLAALKRLRETVLQKLPPTKATNSIYWSRSGSNRSVTNFRRLKSLLEKIGFSAVDPGALSFTDQIASLRSAKRLVAVGGALMSNFIFANSSTKIYFLISKLTADYEMPKYLANISGCDLILIEGKPAGVRYMQNFIQKLHASYKVELRVLKQAIQKSP